MGNKFVGYTLKNFRKFLKKTQAEVAIDLGCSQATISYIERGKAGEKSEFKKLYLAWAEKSAYSFKFII